MAMLKNRAQSRDAGKEAIWRGNIEKWRSSGVTQAEFCRQQHLDQNSFSSWKRILEERGAEGVGKSPTKQTKAKPNKPNPGRVQTSSQNFIELSVAESMLALAEANKISAPARNDNQVAAELINIETGCKLRIFNGADQSTLIALLSAWGGS